jgi:hypothetical protein
MWRGGFGSLALVNRRLHIVWQLNVENSMSLRNDGGYQAGLASHRVFLGHF